MTRRKDPRFQNVRIEYTPDAVPITKALACIARDIARKLYEERHGKKEAKA